MISSYWCRSQAEPLAKFDVLLNGDAFFTAGMVHQNTDAGARSVDFMNRFRLAVTPTVQADDGVTYGARLRVRASIHTGIIDGDQAYVFTQGRFGTIEAGAQFNPSLPNHVIAPGNFGTGGIDGDWAIGDAGWIQNQLTFLEPYFGGGYTVTTFVKDANRVNYLSPRLFSDGEAQHGLLATLSYAPVNRAIFTEMNRSLINTDSVGERPFGYGRTTAFSNCLGGPDPIGCNYHDVYEGGLRYDGSVFGVTVASNLTYLGGSTPGINFGTPQSFYDLSAWQTGLQFGLDGLLVGGSYLYAGRSAYPRQSAATGPLFQDDQFTWTAGMSYQTGPVSVGFNMQYGHDAGDLTVPGPRIASLYAIGTTFRLAPGLSFALEALRSTTRNEPGFKSDPLGFGAGSSGNANLFLWKSQVTV